MATIGHCQTAEGAPIVATIGTLQMLLWPSVGLLAAPPETPLTVATVFRGQEKGARIGSGHYGFWAHFVPWPLPALTPPPPVSLGHLENLSDQT